MPGCGSHVIGHCVEYARRLKLRLSNIDYVRQISGCTCYAVLPSYCSMATNE
jgi:hypothetical protein